MTMNLTLSSLITRRLSFLQASLFTTFTILTAFSAMSGILFALCSSLQPAYASAFQLFEQSPALTGQAYVASAAMANDATSEFYNPAGLVRLQYPQFIWGAIYAHVGIDYHGDSTFPGIPGMLPGLPTETGHTEGGASVVIPSLYYAQPLNDRWIFAFGMWSPFGLITDYSASSLVRYTATRSALTVIDFSPALAYRINNQWSIGAALDAEFARVHLDSRFPTTVLGAPLGTPDAKITNEANDWQVGWHGGVLYQYTPQTRVGLSYHSSMRHQFEGDSQFTSVLPAIARITQHNLHASITLPAYASLGLYHDINDSFAAMISADYTMWHTIDKIHLKNVAFPGGPVNQTFVQKYHDTWRFGVAGHYKPTTTTLVRAGIAYDQTPTQHTDRSIRLPDGDRVVVGLGTHWKLNDELGLDLSYSHMFIADGKLDNATEVGKAKSDCDLVGLQLTWDLI